MTADVIPTLAADVRQQRLQLGWTQTQAGARAGMSSRAYQRFEQSGKISLERLTRVLEAVGLMIVLVPAGDMAVAAPDARLTRTRQRGLRRAGPATKGKPEERPGAAGDGASSLPARREPAPPRRLVRMDSGRVAIVAKKHRNRIVMAARVIVASALTNYTAFQVVQNIIASTKDLDEGDRPVFIAAVVAQLNGLNAENIAGYGLSKAQFERWVPGWNVELGIVDVVAASTET